MKGSFIINRVWGFEDVFNIDKAPDLFVPLKTEYFEAFERGEKREELRLYGARWNEETCRPGRNVTLSKGYGKKNRLRGNILSFKKQHGTTFGSTYKAAIMACYGTLDVWIACFYVDHIYRVQP